MSTPTTLEDQPLTVAEKFSLLYTFLKTLFFGIVALVLSPFRGSNSPGTLRKYVTFRCVKTFLNGASLRHLLWLNKSTDEIYRAFAQRRGFPVDSFALSDGCKAHWIGNRSAKKVLLYFHGGGYVNPPSPGLMEYLLDLQQCLERQGHDVALCLLAYTLASQVAWPNPLFQAAEVLNTLVDKYDKRPEDIILAGDSAGGNLVLALCSHMLHPHPAQVPRVKLAAPLAAVVLISPWVGFDVTLPAFRSNYDTDIMDGVFLEKTARRVVGPRGSDEYIEPVTADVGWFKGLGDVVGDVLVWGGGGEILIDSIRALGSGLKAAHSRTETIIMPKASHEEIIMDFNYHCNKSKYAIEVQDWIAARL